MFVPAAQSSPPNNNNNNAQRPGDPVGQAASCEEVRNEFARGFEDESGVPLYQAPAAQRAAALTILQAGTQIALDSGDPEAAAFDPDRDGVACV